MGHTNAESIYKKERDPATAVLFADEIRSKTPIFGHVHTCTIRGPCLLADLLPMDQGHARCRINL